jgi:hypothetical protein
MRTRQLSLALDGAADEIPVVYLACRLTNIGVEQRKQLDSWCTHIEQAVTDGATQSDQPWVVAVHSPFMWSAPWTKDGRTDEAVYQLNSRMPDLNDQQRTALGTAADEYEWSGSTVLALETRARLELSRAGVRRLRLVSPADWIQFRERTDHHD